MILGSAGGHDGRLIIRKEQKGGAAVEKKRYVPPKIKDLGAFALASESAP